MSLNILCMTSNLCNRVLEQPSPLKRLRIPSKLIKTVTERSVLAHSAAGNPRSERVRRYSKLKRSPLFVRGSGRGMAMQTQAIADVASGNDAPSDNETSTSDLPDVMYGWRVKALDNWLEQRKQRMAKEGKDADSNSISMAEIRALGHLDQYHYRGLVACDELIDCLGLDTDARVFDVGAGVGGPARYIAHQTGCSITGIELQSQLVEAGDRLTSATGLTDKVKLITGDACDSSLNVLPENNQKFTHVFSLLTILHIPDRKALFNRLYELLREEEGGVMLIEDMTLTPFGEENGWTDSEVFDACDTMGAALIPSVADYIGHLEEAGFIDIKIESLTDDWRPWAIQRAKQYESDEENQIKVNGEAVFENRVNFYNAVSRLFASGKLGGSRITCRRPSKWEQKLNNGLTQEVLLKSTREMKFEEVKIIETLANGSPQAESEEVTTEAKVVEPVKDVFPLGAHDCWQWHFMPSGKSDDTAAVLRVWHSDTSVFRAWAWTYNTTTGEQETLFDTGNIEGSNMSSVRRCESDGRMIVTDNKSGRVLTVMDSMSEGGAGCLTVYPSSDLSSTPLLNVDFTSEVNASWAVPSQKDAVIHRPVLNATVEISGSSKTSCLGYSKRYYGDYPREWAYSFIVARQDEAEVEDGERNVLWTAHAKFGKDSYNYWKDVVAKPGSEVRAEDSTLCYHQGRVGRCSERRIELELLSPESEVCTSLTSQRGAHSLLKEALCKCTLKDRESGEVIWTGLAFSEGCMGSI